MNQCRYWSTTPLKCVSFHPPYLSVVVTIFAAATTDQKLAGKTNKNKTIVKFSCPFRATKLTGRRREKNKQRTNSQNKAAQQDPRGNNPEESTFSQSTSDTTASFGVFQAHEGADIIVFERSAMGPIRQFGIQRK